MRKYSEASFIRRSLLGLGFAAALALAPAAAKAGPADEALALYRQFAAAQNTRNIDAVRALFLPSPDFLWVSDGMSVWGIDAVLKRMALFQEAETWRVEPDLGVARAVAIDDRSAFLHLPLVLVIGPSAKPERFGFLVTMLCVETQAGWRISGLFTTTDKAR